MISRFRPFYYGVDPNSKVEHALRRIKSDFEVDVYVKPKALIKFRRNINLSTSLETVWILGGDETYQTSNAINTVVSDDPGDDQDIIIEGHTIDGSGDFTFVVQPATLTGTDNVTLTTPLARATRIYNNDNTDFAGTITVFVDGGTNHLRTDGS